MSNLVFIAKNNITRKHRWGAHRVQRNTSLIIQNSLGLYLLSEWMSYPKTLWSLDGVKFGFRLSQSLWNFIRTLKQRYRDACQISDSELYHHYDTQSHGWETSRDLAVSEERPWFQQGDDNYHYLMSTLWGFTRPKQDGPWIKSHTVNYSFRKTKASN